MIQFSVSRQLQLQIVPTHVPGINIVYSKWEDEEKFSHIICHDHDLPKYDHTLKAPIKTRVNIEDLPHGVYVFLKPSDVIQMNVDGTWSGRDTDWEAFKPTVFGEAPDPTLGAYIWDFYYGKGYNIDRSYAVTAMYLSECWGYFKRKKTLALLQDPTYQFRIVEPSYYVPGNGDMFSVVCSMTQDQYAAWQSHPKKLIGRNLRDLITFLGLNLEDYLNEDQD